MIPSAESLQRANEILRQIESLQSELVSLFNGSGARAAGGGTTAAPAKRRGRPPGSGKKRRQMSPEGRARIAAAARARWARYHAQQSGGKS